MRTYFNSSKDAVDFVRDLLRYSEKDLPLITIISPDKSGACSATIVTTESSADTAKTRYRPYMTTSWPRARNF